MPASGRCGESDARSLQCSSLVWNRFHEHGRRDYAFILRKSRKSRLTFDVDVGKRLNRMEAVPTPPARIADVAARAGVGIATVSRVVNNRGNVAAATRERVLEAIRALEYRPS